MRSYGLRSSSSKTFCAPTAQAKKGIQTEKKDTNIASGGGSAHSYHFQVDRLPMLMCVRGIDLQLHLRTQRVLIVIYARGCMEGQ